MNIKTRILLSVFLLELIGYGLLLAYSNQTTKTTLLKSREDQIQAIIFSNYYRINALSRLIEHKAIDIAKAGERFYGLKDVTPDAQLEPTLIKFLVDTITNFPESIGGGIWYEPNVFYANKTYYGPYAFWNDKKQVEFTWDLNTPTYDYHHQGWYLSALPKDWARSTPRPQQLY